MTRPSIFICSLLAVFALATVSLRSTSANPTNRTVAAQAWQHLAMPVKGEEFKTEGVSEKIVELGTQGWQLVDVETCTKAGTTTQMIYFFKREKTE